MGDLLTDEELKKILESAVQKAFFEPRKHISADSWGSPKQMTTDPVFVELCRVAVQEKAHACIKEWLAANGDVIKKQIDELLAKGMLKIVQDYINSATHGPLQNLANELRTKGLIPY